jgi:hypothetical protein
MHCSFDRAPERSYIALSVVSGKIVVDKDGNGPWQKGDAGVMTRKGENKVGETRQEIDN